MNLQESLNALEESVKNVIESANSDDKTSLYNALALRKNAESFGKSDKNFDVIVFGDLNRFKGLNDSFGHKAGDTAIKFVGEMIQELFVKRCNAKAFRQSGDEFVILLQSKDLEHFKSLTDTFAVCEFHYEDKNIKTAMSFGYAVSKGEIDFDTLQMRAENACQYAKSQGDGVCVEWTEEIEQESLIHLRNRCNNCGARIICNVPLRHSPQKLKCCPFCKSEFI